MANTTLNKVTVNKISKTKYDALVNDGTITPTMIREQVWILDGDQYVSSVDKTNWNNKADASDIPTKTSQLTNDSDFATTSQIPTKVSQLTNDSHYITNADIPTNVSAFNNDAGYLTEETDPTVPSWAKQSTKPTYTKEEIGLGNVENKSSATIRGELTSSNVTTALGFTPMNAALKGANNGVAELDSTGKVPSSQLPAYVDDVLEFDTRNDFPATGESGKIYIAKDTNLTYRWSGSTYVTIASDLALGETETTAYRGDRGKIAYDHSQSAHAPVNAQANVIESITVNGNTQTITDKTVNIPVPTNVSQLNNDSGYLTTESDPVFSASPAGGITSSDIDSWNGKAELTDIKNATLTIKKNNTSVGTFSANQSTDEAINIEVPVDVSELNNDSHYITTSNNTVKNIIEISYEDYKDLETNNQVDPDTEYHIQENGDLSYFDYIIEQKLDERARRDHPIGSLEFNTTGTNPELYLGFGTWELWGQGRVPIGVDPSDSSIDEADKVTGNKTKSYTPAGTNTGTAVTLNAIELTHSGGAVKSHTLTAAESGLPAHAHSAGKYDNATIDNHAVASGNNYQAITATGSSGVSSSRIATNNCDAKNASSGHSHDFTQPSKHSFTPTTKTVTQPTFTGTQTNINVVQPSIACYMWKRIA